MARVTPAERFRVLRFHTLDGTWHRPFATLELASLRSLVDPEQHLELAGMHPEELSQDA